MKSTSKGILASIFDGFWLILGGKLGSKWFQKSMQKHIEKTMQIQMRFGCVLGGCSEGRAMEAQPRPPPLLHIFLRKAPTNTNAHATHESHTPNARQRGGGYKNTVFLYKILYFYIKTIIFI